MNTIIIEKRGNDYMAYLEGHPEIWGQGLSIVAAIGDIIWSHSITFDIKIKIEN
jgi:hypothetical protein